jgi:hypothetical protein
MGTRSVIAIPDAEHGWRGRYSHWDGSPSGVGEALRQIVNRDGYTTAVRTLTEEHYGWSSVHPDHFATTEQLGVGYTDGRFASVPGYGVAYTTAQGQSSPDDWITPDGDDWGTEWAYLLGEGGMAVFERTYGEEQVWRKLGFVAYTDAKGMSRVERCADDDVEVGG